MNIGDITALKDLGLLEGIGVIVLFVLLSNGLTFFNLIKGKIKGKKSFQYTAVELQSIIDRAIMRAVKIFDLKEYRTLKEQMFAADKATLSIKSLILESYQKSSSFEGCPNKDRDVRAFSKILDSTMIIAKEALKDWIKANHILEKTDPEFLTYAKETVSGLLTLVSTTIDNEYYSDDFYIHRETLKKEMYENIAEKVGEKLHKLLYDMREIAIDKKREIEDLEAESFFENDDSKE